MPTFDPSAMQRIEHLADLSIRRACAFGVLAIGTMMIGVASDLMLSMRMGAIGITFMGAVLLIKALRAPRRNYRHTEVWLMLGRSHGLPEACAQDVFGRILHDRYMWHATVAMMVAGALWASLIVAGLALRLAAA